MQQYPDLLPALPPGNNPINPGPKKIVKIKRIRRKVGTA